MRVSIKLLVSIVLAFSASVAFAGPICLKNKDGVNELWQTNETTKSKVKSELLCDNAIKIVSVNAKVEQAADVTDKREVKLGSSSNTGMAVLSQSPKHISPPPPPPRAVVTAATQDAPTEQIWLTSPSNNTMRELIAKWADSVAWTLVWSYDKDIPIESSDRAVGDFKFAVRKLLETTALIDIKLKPCFYTNRVVRVVRETTKCNPNE